MSKHTDKCPATKYFSSDDKMIFVNSQFGVSIGDITTTSLEGETTKYGWGLKLTNYKRGNDKAYIFAYCPWCGAKLDDGATT